MSLFLVLLKFSVTLPSGLPPTFSPTFKGPLSSLEVRPFDVHVSESP